jgi:hypothetical protein
MVPRNDKAVVPITAERVRQLRKHLVVALRALRTMKNPEHSVSSLRPEPEGFAARVARTACSVQGQARALQRVQRHAALPVGSRGLLAEWNTAAGRLTVMGAAKVPFFRTFAEFLGAGYQ